MSLVWVDSSKALLLPTEVVRGDSLELARAFPSEMENSPSRLGSSGIMSLCYLHNPSTIKHANHYHYRPRIIQ